MSSINSSYINSNRRNNVTSKNSSDFEIRLFKIFTIKKDVKTSYLSNIIIPSEIFKTINNYNNMFYIIANSNNTYEINLTIGDYDLTELITEIQAKIRTATNNNNFLCLTIQCPALWNPCLIFLPNRLNFLRMLLRLII